MEIMLKFHLNNFNSMQKNLIIPLSQFVHGHSEIRDFVGLFDVSILLVIAQNSDEISFFTSCIENTFIAVTVTKFTMDKKKVKCAS